MTDETTTPAAETLHPPINREDANDAAKGLISRAEHIAKSIGDLSVHEAIVVFRTVTDMLSNFESREKALVKTKFEEAMMWMQRHVVSETNAQLQQQAAQEAAAATVADPTPPAPEGSVVPTAAPLAH